MKCYRGVPRRRFPTASRRPPLRYRDRSLPLAWLPGAWIGDGKISQVQIGEFLRQTLARLCLDWLQCRRRLQLGRRQGAHQFLDVLKLAGVCVVTFRGIEWLSMPSFIEGSAIQKIMPLGRQDLSLSRKNRGRWRWLRHRAAAQSLPGNAPVSFARRRQTLPAGFVQTPGPIEH